MTRNYWEKITSEDGQEFLYAHLKVENLSQAYKKADAVIRIIDEHSVADESEVSMTSDRLRIVLHGHLKDPIIEKDWEIAEQIEASLT